MSAEPMPVLTDEGTVWIEVDGAEDRSLLGSYWNEIHVFRDTGDLSGLASYEGVEIEGVPLLTDPDQIEFWAYQGELDFPEIYRPYG